MKEWIVKNWYLLVVHLVGIFALILALGDWNFSQKILLCSMIFIQLHFFEEFSCPGGFPYVGVKIELKKEHLPPTEWSLNNASAFWGNEWFAIAVYLSALLFPNIKFLTLAVVLFAFIELLGHLVIFNILLKKFYNPGLYTTLFGLVPLALVYIIKMPMGEMYQWSHYLIALIWIVCNYWIAFRSPIYEYFGRKTKYSVTDEEMKLAKRYM